jgi:hypothetical protein
MNYTNTEYLPHATITRAKALKPLTNHGIDPDLDQDYNPVTNTYDPGTSFYNELGDHSTYNLHEVLAWLGY